MTDPSQTMRGKVCLVTGATGGLGQATAVGLARLGAEVVIVGRNAQRIAASQQLIREQTGCDAVSIQADLSSQSEVRRAAGEFLSRYNSLDVLVNNVGGNFLSRQTTVDGIEMAWALNYLNHFLLTGLLIEALKRAAAQQGEARILEISSSIYRISNNDFGKPQKGPIFNGVYGYALTKRAMIMFAIELSRRLAGTGISINAMSPGFVATNVAHNNGPFWRVFMKTISRFAIPLDDGAQPIVHLVSSPELKGVTGRFFLKSQPKLPDTSCRDEQSIRHLWQISEQATRITIP